MKPSRFIPVSCDDMLALFSLVAVLTFCVVGVLGMTSCTTIKIHDEGAKMDVTATSFGTKAAIKSITVKGPDGITRTISGYASDQVEGLQVMAGLAAEAAAATVKAAVRP